MAIVNLKQVEVARVNSRGHGVQVVEKWESKGASGQTRFTVWFDSEHGLSVGDKIDVSGFLGAKVGEPWTDRDGNQRTSVELSLNSPRIGSEKAVQGQPVQSAGDSWNTPGTYSDESPF
jgi:hypothetical protein